MLPTPRRLFKNETLNSAQPEEVQRRLDCQHRTVGKCADLIGASDLAPLAKIPQRSFLANNPPDRFRGEDLFQRRLGFVQGDEGTGEVDGTIRLHGDKLGRMPARKLRSKAPLAVELVVVGVEANVLGVSRAQI